MRFELLSDWTDRVTPGAELWIEGEEEPRRVTRLESGGRVPVLHLSGVESREAAEGLAGRYLEAPPPALAADAYFWEELIGLKVETPDGVAVGELVEVFRAGGNEVYRVVGPAGERLVPALRSVVEKIDLDTGVMVVAPDDAEEVR